MARGAMSEVWLARDEARAVEVAVKVARIDGASDDERARARARARREAEIGVRLARETEHVVAVVDSGEEGGAALLVMERLVGATLDAQLAAHGPLPLDAVVAIARQVAAGLAVAHRHGVVHGDVKPDNLFATRAAGGAPLVKLLDFGLAYEVVAPPDVGARAGSLPRGTPSYMSPEQRAGAPPSPAFDAWALAVTLFELVAGHVPWPGESAAARLVAMEARSRRRVREARPELPVALEGFFDAVLGGPSREGDVVALSDAFARAARGAVST